MQVNPGAVEENPLLTIAIPTYNRSELLRQLFDSLREQIRDNPRVSLLVSDNASTDQTESTVQEERFRGIPLEYIRNLNNIGADANFLQCYERAKSKYVWIVGDDDLLHQDAIRTVMGHIEKDEYDIVFVEQAGFNDPAGITVQEARKEAIVCSEAVQFLRRVHIFTTLISCNIINKDRVSAIPHQPFSTLIDSALIQLGWTFTALRGHRKSLYIPQHLVHYRLANTGGYGVSQVFGSRLAVITEEWLATPKLNRIILNASLQRLLPSFVLASRKNSSGAYSEENPKALLFPVFRRNPRYWLFIYPILMLPSRLAWVWLQLVRVINRLDRAFGYPSLSW